MWIEGARVLDQKFRSRFLSLQLIICKSKSSTVIYITCSTTRTQSFNESWQSNFWWYLVCSSETGRICVQFGETATAWTWGSMMRSFNPLNSAPIAWMHDSPLEELPWTVENGVVLRALVHKQMKQLPMQDQCKKNFANWSKFDGVWKILVFEFLNEFERIVMILIWFFLWMKILLCLSED